jgi:hypothetical protein
MTGGPHTPCWERSRGATTQDSCQAETDYQVSDIKKLWLPRSVSTSYKASKLIHDVGILSPPLMPQLATSTDKTSLPAALMPSSCYLPDATLLHPIMPPFFTSILVTIFLWVTDSQSRNKAQVLSPPTMQSCSIPFMFCLVISPVQNRSIIASPVPPSC